MTRMPAEEDLSSYFPDAEAAKKEFVFDESAYLAANPDVAEKVTRGELPSGHFHYLRHGKSESRPLHVNSERANIDAVICTASGSLFLIGWAEEIFAKVLLIRVATSYGSIDIPAPRLLRFRRTDVENALSCDSPHHFGFCALASAGTKRVHALPSRRFTIFMEFENGSVTRFESESRIVEDAKLLETVLGYVSGVEFCGNRHVELMYALDGGFGDELIAHNKRVNESLISAASCMWRGDTRLKPRASLIVCLYGKPEFMFLQAAALFGCAGSTEYEVIYVCNSPELAEPLVRSAAVCKSVYGAQLSVIALPGNAGFGGANNVAVNYANSNRIIIANPDVFPMSPDWIAVHDRVLAGPEDRARLFGSRLFYADGSLMHAGMYFEADAGISLGNSRVRQRPMMRVEHYGKGAPPNAFAGSAKVPAVSGAFISVDRKVFESLNGFSDEVVYGHYEDADLCLRARQQGVETWVHDIPMWHLEGKGSSRQPHHEGASLINRWFFARKWFDTISDGLLGQKPNALRETQPTPAIDFRSRANGRPGSAAIGAMKK